jgi:hypothetical protein
MSEVHWLRAEVAALHGQEAPDVGLLPGFAWERGANGLDGLPTWQLNDPDGCAVTRIIIGDVRSWEGWPHTDRVQARSLTEAMRAVAVHYDAVWTEEEIWAEIARLDVAPAEECLCGPTRLVLCEPCRRLPGDEQMPAGRHLNNVLDDKMARMHELLATPWVRPPAGPVDHPQPGSRS